MQLQVHSNKKSLEIPVRPEIEQALLFIQHYRVNCFKGTLNKSVKPRFLCNSMVLAIHVISHIRFMKFGCNLFEIHVIEDNQDTAKYSVQNLCKMQ